MFSPVLTDGCLHDGTKVSWQSLEICCVLQSMCCCLLQAVEVEVHMPVPEHGRSDFCWSVAAKTSEKLSPAVKSEYDGLIMEQTPSSSAMSVRCTASPDDLMSADMCSTVRVKQEPGLSCQDQQRELASSYESRQGICCRADCDDDVLCGVKVKQEPVASNTYYTPVTGGCNTHYSPVTGEYQPVSSNTYYTPVAGEYEPVTVNTYYTPVTGECNTYHTPVTGEGELSASSTELASAVPVADLKVETCLDRVAVNTVNGHCDNLSAAAAAAAAADVNAVSSELQTCLSEASQLPVATQSVPSCVCDSHSLSTVASGTVMSAAASDTVLSVPQELVQYQDTFGKTYYIPRSLLQQVQSSSAVNCTESITDCPSLSNSCVLSAVHSTNRPPVTLSGSEVSVVEHDDVLPSLCDVDAHTSAKSVVSSKSDGHITTDINDGHITTDVNDGHITTDINDGHVTTDINDGHITTDINVCRELGQPSVTTSAISSSYSVTLSNSVSSAALVTVTVPSSVQCTLSLSCSSLSSTLTKAAPLSRQVHQICLISDKHRNQVQMPSNAVIKPRPLVPFCSVNSPARSLPHITVVPSSSAVLTASRNTTPVGSVVTTQTPMSHTCAKLPVSSSSPVYLVVGGNTKVVSGSSRAVMEVVVVPRTKDITRTVMCSTQTVSAAALSGRCISTVSAGLSRCNKVVRALSPRSVICVPSLHKVSKVSQTSRSSSQFSVLRRPNSALSTAVTKPSSAENATHSRAPIKRTSSSSSLNVFATKIGNQTVIVDIGNLSSSNSAAAAAKLSSVTTVACPSSMKSRDVPVSTSASLQQDSTSLCGNIVLQSSTPCMDSASSVITDDVFENCAPVIRYINCFLVLIF